MPLTGFDAWISQRPQQHHQVPLHTLKDAVIGIEASLFLKRFTSMYKEPLYHATGGIPFTLRQNILNDLTKLKDAGIKPLFVFNGLSLLPQTKASDAPDPNVAVREKAWSLYDQGQADKAVDVFRSAAPDSVPNKDIERYFMDILIEHGIEFQVAPYLAWAQLAYLESCPQGFIDGIWASSEIFLFDVEKAITAINFEKNTFTFVNKRNCLQELGLSDEHFVDVALLSGSSLLTPLPPLDSNVPPEVVFKNAQAALQRNQGATRAIKSYPAAQTGDYLAKFQRLRAAIRFHPIFTVDGTVQLLNAQDAPGDVHEFIGYRLPDELYFYLSRGAISARLIDMLVSQQLSIKAPLDGGDSEEYRKLLDILQPIRGQSLSLIVQAINRYWLSIKVDVTYWYEKHRPRTLVMKEIEPRPSDIISKWHVHEEVFREKLGSNPANLEFAITSLLDKDFAAKTVGKKVIANLLKTKDEIVLNTYWRFLQLRGYVDESHNLTDLGHALAKACETLTDNSFIENVIVAFELLRLKLLKYDASAASPGTTNTASEETRQHIHLISRICSLRSLNHAATGYSGPLSRQLLAFDSLANTVIFTLRDLFEGILANLLLSTDAEKNPDADFNAIAQSLPFAAPVNCAGGILTKEYFDNLGEDTSDENKQRQIPYLKELFPQVADVEDELFAGWALWGAIVSGVKLEQVQKTNLFPLQDKIKATDEWLWERMV